MLKSTLFLSFWPGLSGLIRHGRGVFLTITLGFGFIASMTLFCSEFWTELISTESKLWLAGGLGVCWLVLTLVGAELSRFFDRQLAYDEEGDRFLLAMNYYLAGRWPESEKVARAILKRNKRDPEILLFLATLYRHSGRVDEASEILDRLERLESAEKWSYEIGVERKALAETAAETEEEEGADGRSDGTVSGEDEPEGIAPDEAAPETERQPATIPFPAPAAFSVRGDERRATRSGG